MKIIYLSLLLTLLIFISFASNTINIGVLLPLTGDASISGCKAELSIKLANDLFNSIKDYRIKIIIKDQESNPVLDKKIAEEMIKDYKVRALIGWIYSSHAFGGTPIAEKYKVPAMCIYATNPLVTKGKKYVSRIVFNDNLQGKVAAEYIYKDLHISKIAVVRDLSQHYSVGLASIFSTSFRGLGGSIDKTYNINSRAEDELIYIKSVAHTIVNDQEKALYMPIYSKETALILKFLHHLNYLDKVLIFSSDTSGILANYLGDDFKLYNNVYYTDQYYIHYKDKNSMAKFFDEQYHKFYKNYPNEVAEYLSFDAYYLIYDAIKRCIKDGKEPTSENINYYVRNTKDLLLTTGRVSIDPKTGDCVKPVFILKWFNGKKLFIKKINLGGA